MRIIDWSSDVCSSDLLIVRRAEAAAQQRLYAEQRHHRGAETRALIQGRTATLVQRNAGALVATDPLDAAQAIAQAQVLVAVDVADAIAAVADTAAVMQLADRDQPSRVGERQRLQHQRVDQTEQRSEEHTSELQSLMRTSYAVFCLKKKKQ